MILHSEISDVDLRIKLKNRTILFGGNINAKIYGTISCAQGKRLKKDDRVFFRSKKEAQKENYRPCGNCLRNEYRKWKDELI